MLNPITEALTTHIAPQEGENIIDVGCGTGQLSQQMSEGVGESGHVLAVDVSEPLLKAARIQLQSRTNVSFVLGDAGTTSLSPVADCLVSQFGVMFFLDPVTSFSNLHRALKPNGRIVYAAWQSFEANDWLQLPLKAFPEIEPSLPNNSEPGPFAFASMSRQKSILNGAGFTNLEFHSLKTQISWGQTPDEAFNTMLELGPMSRILAKAAPENRTVLEARLQAFLATQYAEGLPSYEAAVWLTHAKK